MTIILVEEEPTYIRSGNIEVKRGEYDCCWIEKDFAILWKKERGEELKNAMKSMLLKKYNEFFKKPKEMKKQ